MSFTILNAAEVVAQLTRYDTIIDARSESEFALDHLPGAVNWPTLNDEERVLIGTMYVQVNQFEAKKRGAAIAARNIAGHIERHVIDKPRDWKPLAYCWRGGKRSGSLSLILDQIGFRVTLVEGGYKALRSTKRGMSSNMAAQQGQAKHGCCTLWQRRALRFWIWRLWPVTVVRCWVPFRVSRNLRKSASTPWFGMPCANLILNASFMWKARVKKSAMWPLQRPWLSACAPARVWT